MSSAFKPASQFESKIVVIGELPASPKFGRRVSCLVPMGETEGWDNNPEIRIRPQNLKALEARLKDVGQLVAGSVVQFRDKKGFIRYRVVDGHRRKAILSSVGNVQYFEATLYPDVEVGTDLFGELFEHVNVGTRVPGIRERVWLALRGERAAAGIEACKIADEVSDNLNSLALEKFEEAGCPTQAFNNSKAAYKQLKERGLVGNDRRARTSFLSDALIWQIDMNEQQAMKLYLTQINQVATAHAGKYGTLGAASKKLCRLLLSYIAGGINIPKPKVGSAPRFEDDEEQAAA